MHTTIFMRERKQSEQAAQEYEQRYKRLVSSVTDYVYSVTIAQGRPVATAHGPGCEAVTGYTSKEFEADRIFGTAWSTRRPRRGNGPGGAGPAR